jgi:hypothetical protein
MKSLSKAGGFWHARADASTAGTHRATPNIFVIFGDDIGQTNVSAYSGSRGVRTALRCLA